MTRYRMDDGTVVDTNNANQSWDEDTRWDGRNHISLATGTQWDHQTLYRSRKGRFYLEHTSQWEGKTPSAEWVSHRTAVSWLMTNEHKIPEDLLEVAESLSESWIREVLGSVSNRVQICSMTGASGPI